MVNVILHVLACLTLYSEILYPAYHILTTKGCDKLFISYERKMNHN